MSSDCCQKSAAGKKPVWLRLIYFVSVFSIVLTISSCEEPEREFISRTRVITDDFVRGALPVGLSVSVKIGGIWEDVYSGLKTAGSNNPIDSVTIFQQGTASLHYVSFLYATALTENVISAQSTLQGQLPGITVPRLGEAQITLQHLAEHSSGLPLNPTNLVDSLTFEESNPYKHYSQDSLIAFLENHTLEFSPGSRYQFSYTGYALLALALENAYATPIEQLFEEKIAQPFGLSNASTFDVPQSLENVLARPYNTEYQELDYWSYSVFKRAVGVYTTTTDLKRIADEYLKESSPLNQQLSIMLEQRTQQTTIAWNITVTNGSPFYYTSGGTSGHEIFFGFSPEQDYAMILMTNIALSESSLRPDLILLASQLLDSRFSN